jgi:addiction module RelE/StbE family toxin
MAQKWIVTVDKKVELKQIPQLPKEVQLLAYEAIEDLKNEGPMPFGWNAKKLKGTKYRLRLKRKYRMIYNVYKQIITIRIIFTGHRKDAEKHY